MQTQKDHPRWPVAAALIVLILAVLTGWYSYPSHPLYQGDITKVGGGYDYFFYYSTVSALHDKIGSIYSSQELLDYTSSLSGGRGWAVNDNHLLPFYTLYLPFVQRTFSDGYYIHLWANLNILWMAML